MTKSVSSESSSHAQDQSSVEPHEEHFDEYDDDDEHHSWLEGHTALRFLAAGGIAGAGE